MSKAHDEDLYLKLRFKRVLFLLGYYSPIEVELSHYQEDHSGSIKRASLTDLDVLGVKYDSVLTSHKIVGDCKSGKHVSDSNRLFWLRGVSDYFGANVAYFVRPKVDSQARSIAPKLGLRVLDEIDLSELERSLKADSLVLPVDDPTFYESRRALWGIVVPKGVSPTSDDLIRKDVYSYLSYEYWYIEQHRNLYELIHHFNKVAHILHASNQRDVLLAYTGLERFAMCILEMGGQVYARGLSDIRKNARIYLYGGARALYEREKFFEFLRKLGTKEELDPFYVPEILELTNRIVHNPDAASAILPYLEAIYSWNVQLGNEDLRPVFGDKLNTAAVVLGRDMAITFCHASGLDEKLFSNLLSL